MNLSTLLNTIHGILNSVIPVIVSLGLVYFIWGVVQYVIADGEEAKKSGKDRIIYGIIGLAIIVSVWGIVNILAKTFGLNNAASPSVDLIACGSASQMWQGGKDGLANIADYIACNINNAIIPLLFAIALATFVWGVVKFFIVDADEEAKRTQGKQFMIWGIIAMTVMLGVWGLVGILGKTLGINTVELPKTATGDGR